MKAIVLAAGEGTRLRPLTENLPKCLVPLRGRPLLDYQLATLRRCGVEEVVLVTGHRADQLRRYGLKSYFNPRFSETNMVYSLFCAREEMTEDVLVCYGDIVYEDRVLRTLLESPHDFVVAVDIGWWDLWSYRMEDPLADAETLRVDESGRLREIGKVPRSRSEIQAQYMGLILLREPCLPRVRALYEHLQSGSSPQRAERMYMTEFIQLFTERFGDVYVAPVRHGWLEVDTLEDLRRYERLPEVRPELIDLSAFFPEEG